MKSSFRWYGDSDPVTLDMIRQIPGMRSIVSAVYDVKPGEVWPEESIKHLVDECAAHGLIFDVVESIPVTEEIKLGKPERDRHIANYCESIRRCAKYGIKCVTYNFMPVFDWTRTQLDKKAADGSTSLVMYWDQMKGGFNQHSRLGRKIAVRADIFAEYADFPRRRPQESADAFHQHGFAAAVPPDDAVDFPAHQLQGNIFQNLLAAERLADVLHVHDDFTHPKHLLQS